MQFLKKNNRKNNNNKKQKKTKQKKTNKQTNGSYLLSQFETDIRNHCLEPNKTCERKFQRKMFPLNSQCNKMSKGNAFSGGYSSNHLI